MLCSPSVSALSFDRGASLDSPSLLPLAPSNPAAHSSGTSTRTPSPALPSSLSLSSPAIGIHRDPKDMASSASVSTPSSNRPRHHLRSFSTENRFATKSTTTPSPLPSPSALNSTPNDNKKHINLPLDEKNSLSSPCIVIDPSSPPATSQSPPTTSLPVRAKRSSPPMSTTNGEGSFMKPQSPRGGSPPKLNTDSPKNKARVIEQEKEQEQLQLLKQQQANRRPKMMRLTPAHSSTPNRLARSSLSSNSEGGKSSQIMSRSVSQDSTQNALQFPAKEEASSVHGADCDPGIGLQIDLGCIPTPSLQDLDGPISTSHLDSLIRDRNGNPIKPSLKSPRSSVSHFMPGRTSRSDSTPALPSSLHSKSVPSTPTVHKAVHFDSHLEHIKLFKNKQKPTAVSRDGSPEQTETETEEEKDLFPYIWRKNSSGGSNSASPTNANFFGNHSSNKVGSSTSSNNLREPALEMEEQLVLRLPNFPSSTRLSVDREIFLERIYLADDLRSVKGTVQVRNMSFEKWVAIRYTLDHWVTIGEVSAEYSETIKEGQADRFTFSIKLNDLLNWPRGSAMHETKSMFMCLRYTVNSTEYWDNNEGNNYQLDFRKRQMPSTPLSTPVAVPVTVLVHPKASVPNTSNSSHNNSTRVRAIELARKGGVGGKGMFAMEDLKRELDKLRSDEEEEIESITIPRFLGADLSAKKRGSPPSSPARAASPLTHAAWTARYDFGQSLRNPRNGSRNTGLGRAAALDYFSAKPMSRTGSNGQSGNTPNTFIGDGIRQHGLNQAGNNVHLMNSSQDDDEDSKETPTTFSEPILSPSKFEHLARNAKVSPDFSHKFGMISPGLGDGPVEHRPSISDSTTPSTTTSPSPTPTPSNYQSPMSDRVFSTPDRFHSYPPNRHSGNTTPTTHPMSPAFFTPPEEFRVDSYPSFSSVQGMQMLDFEKGTKRNDESIQLNQYSPSASPTSDGDSPNPFSPSDSLSSVDSDTTVSNSATPDDRIQQKNKSTNAHTSITYNRYNHADGNNKNNAANAVPLMTTSSSTASLKMPGGYSSSFHHPSASEDQLISESNWSREDEKELESSRPASMSDYQELINKYCWNNDLVPSGGSTIPDMPMNGGLGGSTTLGIEGQSKLRLSPSMKSPALSGSGTSTPTLG